MRRPEEFAISACFIYYLSRYFLIKGRKSIIMRVQISVVETSAAF